MHPQLRKEDFQQVINGAETNLFFLSNTQKRVVAITNYGARIVAINTPDARGESTNIVFGYACIDDYLNTTEVYHGAVVGRFANRIANGTFTLGENTYTLSKNNYPNHLHGGAKGFHQAVWEVTESNTASITMLHFSPDSEEGYPGNLHLWATYTLTEDNKLKLSFRATTDKDTVINLTNHAYFNLNGVGNGYILNHILKINADYFTPVDATSIPLGSFEPVQSSPFDFRSGKTIGESINAPHAQLIIGNGFDHNFVLNKDSAGELTPAAIAIGDKSGIKLEVFTTEPGMQLYTGLDSARGNGQTAVAEESRRSTFCLETQHFPDSPNHSGFPSTVLKAGSEFTSETIFKLGVIS